MASRVLRQTQRQYVAIHKARQSAWRSIVARCGSGWSCPLVERILFRDVMQACVDVDREFSIHPMNRPIPDHLLSRASLVLHRVQDLERRLSQEPGPEAASTKPSQPICVSE